MFAALFEQSKTQLAGAQNGTITDTSGNPMKTIDDMFQHKLDALKGVLTDVGFDNTVKAQQMFGGHGYIAEHGMEQFVRDARITMMYEGANGIQALDLVGRKLPKDGGRALQAFFAEVQGFCAEHGKDDAMKVYVEPLGKALGHLQAIDRVDPVEELGDGTGLVGLELANVVPGEPLPGDGGDLRNRLLEVVLTKISDSRGPGGQDRLGRLGLADPDQGHAAGGSAGAEGRFGDAPFEVGEVAGQKLRSG